MTIDDEDGVLKRLAELAQREKQREPDAAWDAVADGDDSIRARLGEADAQVEAAFKPLGEGFEARIAAAALDALETPEPAPAHATEPGATVIPFRRTPAGRALTVLVPLVAAAALVFWVARPTGPALPTYQLSVTGGEKVQRSEAPDPGIVRLTRGSQLTLTLVPQASTTESIETRAWLQRDGQVEPWAIEPRITAQGSVLIEGTFESLGLDQRAAGDWTVVVGVGARGDLPDRPDRGGDWQRFQTRVRLAP